MICTYCNKDIINKPCRCKIFYKSHGVMVDSKLRQYKIPTIRMAAETFCSYKCAGLKQALINKENINEDAH